MTVTRAGLRRKDSRPLFYRDLSAVPDTARAGRDPSWLNEVVRAKQPRPLPVMLTRQEVHDLLAAPDWGSWIMATMLYGSGLRLMECLWLRVKDVDIGRSEVLVREGKGDKDRVTMLPSAVVSWLNAHAGN